MRRPFRILPIIAAALLMAAPPAAFAKPVDGQKTAAPRKAPGAKAAKTRWRGYGFLPGYEQPPNLTDWRIRSSRRRAAYDPYEPRYVYFPPYSYYGRLQYGWGGPGFYRGRWNGGSFGPCWTQTPIGMVWNCGP